jgi:drug/metabolite transporter (DMT)-like permease
MLKIDELPAAPVSPKGGERMLMKGLSMNTAMLILAATVLGIAGQLMLKQGMTAMGPLSVSFAGVPQIVWRMITSPMVIGGLAIYGFGTFFWLITLSRLELSFVYPFVTLNQVIVFLIAWVVLREQVSPMRALGVAVICVGMLLIART